MSGSGDPEYLVDVWVSLRKLPRSEEGGLRGEQSWHTDWKRWSLGFESWDFTYMFIVCARRSRS